MQMTRIFQLALLLMIAGLLTGFTSVGFAEEIPGKKVGWLELSGPLREGPSPVNLGSLEENGPTSRALLKRISSMATDDSFLGLIVYLDDPWLSFHLVDDFAEAFKRLREAGKPVLAFSQSYDLLSYLLACETDKILLQHRGEINVVGLGMEEMYLKGLLEKIGAQADFVQMGRFKGADEQMTRTAPSEEWSRNIDAVLDDLYDQIVMRVAERRGLQRDQVTSFFADCWTLTDAEYVDRRVVDQLVDRDLIDVTSDTFGDEFSWHDMHEPLKTKGDWNSPLTMFSTLFAENEVRLTRDTIALIHLDGPIISGESGATAPSAAWPFGSDNVGSRTISSALSDAMDNELIRGVVLRVDSPGGSALASEMIWQDVRQISQYKPVYVCLGDTAASGGYYVACAGDRIYASPSTVVGSIGVVGGKIVFGSLYEKVGVTITRRSRGPLGDMFNSVEPFSAEQRVAVLAGISRVYDQFLDRVKIGRGDRIKDINKVAEGRLFTGRLAVENGLVDEIGSIDQALADMAKSLKLEPGKYDVMDFPPPVPLSEYIMGMFGMKSEARAPASVAAPLEAAKQVIGQRYWSQVEPILIGMTLLRHEHVLTLMPNPIIFR